MEFARQLQATVDPAIKDRDQRMYEAKEKALADGVVSRNAWEKAPLTACLLYTSPSPRDQRGSRMPSSA